MISNDTANYTSIYKSPFSLSVFNLYLVNRALTIFYIDNCPHYSEKVISFAEPSGSNYCKYRQLWSWESGRFIRFRMRISRKPYPSDVRSEEWSLSLRRLLDLLAADGWADISASDDGGQMETGTISDENFGITIKVRKPGIPEGVETLLTRAGLASVDLAPVSPDGLKRLLNPVRDARAANAF